MIQDQAAIAPLDLLHTADQWFALRALTVGDPALEFSAVFHRQGGETMAGERTAIPFCH